MELQSNEVAAIAGEQQTKQTEWARRTETEIEMLQARIFSSPYYHELNGDTFGLCETLFRGDATVRSARVWIRRMRHVNQTLRCR